MKPSSDRFPQNGTYLPITMKQFEDLTNEILVEINKLCEPHALDADYMAQILMSAIHALDHKHGVIKKSDLFDSCVNRVSCHITYHVVQEIQKKLKKENKSEGTTEEAPDDGLDNQTLSPAPASANEQIQ